jgi:hypothetical protein
MFPNFEISTTRVILNITVWILVEITRQRRQSATAVASVMHCVFFPNFDFGFFFYVVYSRVPNKRTGRLLENDKKSHLNALIWDCSFINFEQKVPPIRLFLPI